MTGAPVTDFASLLCVVTKSGNGVGDFAREGAAATETGYAGQRRAPSCAVSTRSIERRASREN